MEAARRLPPFEKPPRKHPPPPSSSAATVTSAAGRRSFEAPTVSSLYRSGQASSLSPTSPQKHRSLDFVPLEWVFRLFSGCLETRLVNSIELHTADTGLARDSKGLGRGLKEALGSKKHLFCVLRRVILVSQWKKTHSQIFYLIISDHIADLLIWKSKNQEVSWLILCCV